MPEEKTASPYNFLRGKPAMAVTVILVAQIVLFYAIPTREYKPSPPPLDQFDRNLGQWVMTKQFQTDQETLDLLRADDTLLRDYDGPSREELFVAFFKSQRAGITPHSPKMCLPANGWAEESSGTTSIAVPGASKPIQVNRYVVSKDGHRNLVLYWFQNSHRVTADEYLSKVYLIYDSLRYHRSDEAMIRVVTEINGNSDARQEQYAIQFIQDLYQPIRRQIWSVAASAAVLQSRH